MHIKVPNNFSGIIQKTVVSDAAVEQKIFILCTRKYKSQELLFSIKPFTWHLINLINLK
jgi:hypothetical protein